MEPIDQVSKDIQLDRRDLMKAGVGGVIAALSGGAATAAAAAVPVQEGEEGGPPAPPPPFLVWSGAGYQNNANRISGNGPMDATTRQLVDYTLSFSESAYTDNMDRVNWTQLDTLVALACGFESEPGRICAKMGMARPGTAKENATIMGYGVSTSVEQAAFANAFMTRQVDFNDSTPGIGHASTMIPGIWAVAEAFHCSGLDVLLACGLSYEIVSALQNAGKTGGGPGDPGGFDSAYTSIAVALACGKLLKLDDDRLANALSLAFVPHLPMSVTHSGILSMWKAGHEPMAVSSAVYAVLMAKDGMTGPSQPFEQRGGWFVHNNGAFRDLKLPVRAGQGLVIQHTRMKEYPVEGSTDGVLEQIPAIRAWAKPDEIASFEIEVGFGQWQEVADPPKWDPHNRETADHSLAFLVASALIYGEIYLDAFTPERYLHDAAIRDLMGKITVRANMSLRGKPSLDGSTALDEVSHMTIRKKSGEVLVKDSSSYRNPDTDFVKAKWKRICEYRQISAAQHDKVLATWPNLREVKDFAEPVRDMAKFGKPMPL